MDPLTAGFNLGTGLLAFASKIWDATPDAQKAQSAGDWATFTHNIAAFLTGLQSKINSAVVPKP